MGRTDLRRNQPEFEASLDGHGRLVAHRMQRAKDYQHKVQHHVAWTDPRLSKALVLGFAPARDDTVLAKVRADPRLRVRPHWLFLGSLSAHFPPPLDPFGPRISHPMEIFHTCPGGGLELTLGELRGMGRFLFEEDWIRLLFMGQPLEKALDIGLSVDSRRNTVEYLIRWLGKTIRSGWPDYAAACFDMYCAGVAVRKGILPRVQEFSDYDFLLEEAERERARSQAWLRRRMREERETFLKESGHGLTSFPLAPVKKVDPDLRESIQDHALRGDLPELSDASKPKKLTAGEQETHNLRSALVRYIRGNDVYKKASDFGGPVGDACSKNHMDGGVKLRPPLRRVPSRTAR